MLNKIVNMYRTPVERVIDKSVERSINIISDRVKYHFGKEYMLYLQINNKESALMRYLKKLNKKFDRYISNNTNVLIPFISISFLDSHTICYMSTLIREDEDNIDTHFLYLFIFGRNMYKYTQKLDDIIRDSKKENVFYTVHSLSSTPEGDVVSIDLEPRDISTLIYSHNEPDIILSHVDRFIDNIDFYKSRNLLYKTGILLYGQPGTGKSTLVKALASKYHRSVISIDITNIDHIDFSMITSMINQEKNEKYIVLFEDIDTLFLNREDNKVQDKNYNNIINKLLQFLDSNSSPTNTIFIATTNHIDRLDSALTRDGRFDLKVEIKGIIKKDIGKFLISFGLDERLKKEIVMEYEKKYDVIDGLYNQSALQNIMLKYV